MKSESTAKAEAAASMTDANGNTVYYTTLEAAAAVAVAGITDSSGHMVCYTSLQEAVDAAANGSTITLLDNTSGSGVVVPSGSDITIDLNGYTYTATSTVGSDGTVTNGFQLLKDSDITIKNGTIEAGSDSIKILVQNYSNLTLRDVTLDGTGSANMQYVLSNNNGTTSIEGATSIIAPDGAVAFDVYDYQDGGYSGVNVTVDTTGNIDGNIEIGGDGTNPTPTLTIKNGTFDGKIIVNDIVAEKMKGFITGGVFASEIPEKYIAEGYGLVKGANGYAVQKETSSSDTSILDPSNPNGEGSDANVNSGSNDAGFEPEKPGTDFAPEKLGERVKTLAKTSDNLTPVLVSVVGLIAISLTAFLFARSRKMR